MCGLGRQVHQRTDCPTRRGAGAQLQHLAKEHENRDDGGGLEIDRRRALHRQKLRGEDLWDQQGDEAVEPGHADAQGDEGEHVEVAGHK